jgi:hypothetical protein
MTNERGGIQGAERSEPGGVLCGYSQGTRVPSTGTITETSSEENIGAVNNSFAGDSPEFKQCRRYLPSIHSAQVTRLLAPPGRERCRHSWPTPLQLVFPLGSF